MTTVVDPEIALLEMPATNINTASKFYSCYCVLLLRTTTLCELMQHFESRETHEQVTWKIYLNLMFVGPCIIVKTEE